MLFAFATAGEFSFAGIQIEDILKWLSSPGREKNTLLSASKSLEDELGDRYVL